MAEVKTGNVTWDLSVTVFHVKRLRGLNPPILLTDPNTLATYLEDAVELYELLWILVESQAVKASIDAEQFAKLFTDNYDLFVQAFVGSLKDFFQKSKRVDLSALIENTLSASTKMLSNAEKTLSSGMMNEIVEKMVENQDKMTQESMQKILTNLSGGSPESLG